MSVGDSMETMLQLLKERTYQIPQLLLFNYKKLELTELEFIMLIYLWNSNNSDYNPKNIGKDLNLKVAIVLETINNLSEKGFLTLDIVKKNNVHSEEINLDLLYEKMAFLLMKKDTKKESTNLFDIYEKELGRGLSPTEYEIINGWKSTGYSEELLLLALKEAIYNGVTNFRYIDRIVFEWNKKGIKTAADVEKNRKEFKKQKNNKEMFDYDWLNDKQDS